jgi:superfamily II DNA or RNA helicase
MRRWQKEALDLLLSRPVTDFMVTATPGAGKTSFGLIAALHALRERPYRPIVVVTPTRNLKVQWARAAARFGLQLDPNWEGGGIPGDMHGVVTTYAQVASRPQAVADVAGDAVALIDEIHHGGAERSWGDSLLAALGGAGLRIGLSGTPFRSDDALIPFVNYVDGQAQADYVYGYADALRDGGVVRPVYFPRLGGAMEWVAPDGVQMGATFEDKLDAQRSSQRLRTALSPHGHWLPDALEQANVRLREVRRHDPRAGGIVFAIDQEHARAIAAQLRRITGRPALLAISDEPGAHDALAGFAESDEPWAVCVRYASEGYDAPRLRVGVYATNVVAPLFWAQALGRVLRWRPEAGPRQAAWMFIPDDARLRELAYSIKTTRTHVLKAREDEDDELGFDRPERAEPEQGSLFQAIAATSDGRFVDDGAEALSADGWHEGPALDDRFEGDRSLEVELPVPPRTTAARADEASFERRALLRRANQERAALIARISGLRPQEVNRRLNDAASIKAVSDASVRQLDRRLQEADAWLAKL